MNIEIGRQYSANPYTFDGVPKCDERFPDPYNMGVNAEIALRLTVLTGTQNVDDVSQTPSGDRRARDDVEHYCRNRRQASEYYQR